MKILLVNKFHYVVGGSETYEFGLAKLLKDAGQEVIFLAMQDERNMACPQEKYFVSKVDFNCELSAAQKLRAGMRMVYSREARRRMADILRDEKPDIIHLNLFHRVFTVSILDAAKEAGIPVVLTVHDLNCICPNHTMIDHGKICEACLHGNYFECVKRVCFKDSRAKCVMAAVESYYNRLSGAYDKIALYITPSEFYRRKMLEAGITHSPILHMKNFLPITTDYRATPRGDYVFYFGRLSAEKGILTLLDAMEKVPAQLILAGEGPLEPYLRERIALQKLEEKVRLVGFQSGKALQNYLYGAGCVVIPSEWYEASGYTACEAQAAGKVVVATRAGGLAENIVDNETGFVCEMFNADAIAHAINRVRGLNDDEYGRMSTSAVQNAKRLFDAETYLQKLLEIYPHVIQRYKAGGNV